MQVTIELLDDEEEIVREIAMHNKRTPEEYVQSIITSWVQAQLRGRYVEKVKTIDLSELKQRLGGIKDGDKLPHIIR